MVLGQRRVLREAAGERVGDPGKHQELEAKLHSHIPLLWHSA